MKRLFALAAVLLVATAPTPAQAALISISPGDLAGANLTTFGPPVVLGSPINGQTINGVGFTFTIGGVPSTSATVSNGGPGNTNQIMIPSVVGDLGVLTLQFPTPQTRLGYGFAVLNTGNVPNATTVQVFDASGNSLGSLSGNGSPDPVFAGETQFAFDNLRFQFVASDVGVIPEPGTLAVFGVLAAGAFGLRRRVRKAA